MTIPDPVLCVPSVSLISGETGVPLEGVAGYATPEEFAEKIRQVNQVGVLWSIH